MSTILTAWCLHWLGLDKLVKWGHIFHVFVQIYNFLNKTMRLCSELPSSVEFQLHITFGVHHCNIGGGRCDVLLNQNTTNYWKIQTIKEIYTDALWLGTSFQSCYCHSSWPILNVLWPGPHQGRGHSFNCKYNLVI